MSGICRNDGCVRDETLASGPKQIMTWVHDDFHGSPTTIHGSPTTTESGSPSTIDESMGIDELGTIDELGSPKTIDESGSPTTIDESSSLMGIEELGSPTTIDESGSPTTIFESGSPATMNESHSVLFRNVLAYIDKESVSTDIEDHKIPSTSAALLGKRSSADIPKEHTRS